MTTHATVCQQEREQDARVVAAGPGLRAKLLLALLVAVALIVAACGSSAGTGSGIDRHGMPDNVPLPSSTTFKTMDTRDSKTQLWYWTVASPNDVTTVEKFYESNLASNGWVHIEVGGSTELGAFQVVGCQGSEGVDVLIQPSFDDVPEQSGGTTTITAPSGGSALEIGVSSDPNNAFGIDCPTQ